MGIELMNVKGNITLGGDVSGQIEFDNTIAQEVKDILSTCKHINTISASSGVNREIVDLWNLEPGIYYFENKEGSGFYGDMTHGTGDHKTLTIGTGSILIISGYTTAKYIEEHEDEIWEGARRSFFIVGNARANVDRIYVGNLAWHTMKGYSGTVNLIESANNRVSTIDPETVSAMNYPTAKAVINYVEECLAAFEGGGGITLEEVQEVIPGLKKGDGAEVFNDYVNNVASGKAANASGYATKATANYANAEGYFTEATANMSHAEGYKSKASGSSSHAEGSACEAIASASHAEGDQTKATGYASHSEGGFTEAQAGYAHAEGYKTVAKGNNSHTEGRFTVASGRAQQVLGKWNIEDTEINEETGYGKYVQIIGNGNEETEERSNAYTLDWEGNAWYQGIVQAAGFIDAEGNPIGGGGECGIKEITLAKAGRVYVVDLEPGFYVIHAPEGGAIACGNALHGVKGDSHMMVSGDNTVAIADAAGITKFRKSYFLTYSVIGNAASATYGITESTKTDGAWTHKRIDGGSFESSSNRVMTITDANTVDHTKYPSTKAVKEYIASQLVPIDIDVGSEHADNEFYNANAVDQVLIEVVGLMEEMMGHIETFALGLDDLTARVEALENK